MAQNQINLNSLIASQSDWKGHFASLARSKCNLPAVITFSCCTSSLANNETSYCCICICPSASWASLRILSDPFNKSGRYFQACAFYLRSCIFQSDERSARQLSNFGRRLSLSERATRLAARSGSARDRGEIHHFEMSNFACFGRLSALARSRDAASGPLEGARGAHSNSTHKYGERW